MDVAFRVFEGGPSTPWLAAGLIFEIHTALLELVRGLKDVINFDDDTGEAADFLRRPIRGAF